MIDLIVLAGKTGFTLLVGCPAAVWNGYVVPPQETRELGRSERGRQHDLLWMLHNAIRGSAGGDRLVFQVIFLQSGGRHETAVFEAACGLGDEREPAVTIMTPRPASAGIGASAEAVAQVRVRLLITNRLDHVILERQQQVIQRLQAKRKQVAVTQGCFEFRGAQVVDFQITAVQLKDGRVLAASQAASPGPGGAASVGG